MRNGVVVFTVVPSVVETAAVPEHVAVPLPATAVVDALVAPVPPSVTKRGVLAAMLLVPVSVTVAVARAEPLKLDKLQVCPAAPVALIPDT